MERGAQNGDHVTLDLAATVDGNSVPDATTEGLSHEVGSGQLIDGLDRALIGLKTGEEAQFTTKLVAGEFADSDADVTVKVGAVKERELPELDDEFAQLASEFDTIDELRDAVRSRVEQSKKIEQANAIRDKVLDELLEKVEFPLPEKIVEGEVQGQLEEILHSIGHDEEMLERLLEAQGTTREEFEANARENAERGVRTQLLLDAIADAKGTEISQEDSPSRSSSRLSATAWRRRSSSTSSSRPDRLARSTPMRAAARHWPPSSARSPSPMTPAQWSTLRSSSVRPPPTSRPTRTRPPTRSRTNHTVQRPGRDLDPRPAVRRWRTPV